MATLATQNITQAGATPSYVAAAGGGDKFSPGDKTFLHVKNGGGSPITVTIDTPVTYAGLAVADVAVSVTNAQERMIGPFPASVFRGSDGLVSVTYSGVTTVTVGVFSL